MSAEDVVPVEPLTPGTAEHTALCHALATVIADISEYEYSGGDDVHCRPVATEGGWRCPLT